MRNFINLASIGLLAVSLTACGSAAAFDMMVRKATARPR